MAKQKLNKMREFRQKLGFNQIEFWGPLGVTQSGGSRYEAGRAVPKPLHHLLSIVYGSSKERSETLHKLTRHLDGQKRK